MSEHPVTRTVLPDVPGNAKVRAMTGIDGEMLREWRRSRGWDVAKTARELRRVASEPIAVHDALVRMIRGWERGDHDLSERYELLYRKVGFPDSAGNDEPEPHPGSLAARVEADNPVKRRTFVELTGISAIDALLPARAAAPPPAYTGPLALILSAQMTSTTPVSAEPPDLTTLSRGVSRARSRCPRLLISGPPRA